VPVYTRPSRLRPTSPNWPAEANSNIHQALANITKHLPSALYGEASSADAQSRCTPRLKLFVAVRGPLMVTSIPSSGSSAASLTVMFGSCTSVGAGITLPDLQRNKGSVPFASP
jgi:hypothetical protein